MLEYSKIILSKVGFNRRIFLKEYRKLNKSLVPEESSELSYWVRNNIDCYREKRLV